MVLVDVLSNGILVISGRLVGDNERLCALKPHKQLKRSPPQASIERGTARKAGMYLYVLTHVSSKTEKWSQGISSRPHQWNSGVLFPLNLLTLYILLNVGFCPNDDNSIHFFSVIFCVVFE